MSKDSLAPVGGIPISVHPVLLNVLQRFKNMQFKSSLEEMIAFVSIIGAYLFMSLSLQNQHLIQELTGYEFQNSKMQSAILLIFALYMITLKLLHLIAQKYENAPPKKVVPMDEEEAQQAQKLLTEVTQEEQKQQKSLSPNSYTTMIQQLTNYSIYGMIFMFCTTSYAFTSVFNKGSYLFNEENNIVEINQVNYLLIWFVTACIFYSFGKLIGKLTQINSLHYFGLATGIILILIEIGLTHGFDMFVFI